MVEQPHTGEGHNNAVFVALLDDQVIPDGAAGLGNIADTGGIGPLDVIREGEEGIGAQRNATDGIQVGPLVLGCEPVGLLREVVLPDALGADILFVAVDVAVNDVIPARTAQIFRKGRFRVLGCCRRNQVSALEPASRVQWIRDCWPAPTPMAWPS